MQGRTVHLNDTEPVATGGEAFPNDKPLGGTLPIDSQVNDAVAGGPLSEGLLRCGQVVDRYRIVRLIASGGMAHVYEAVHAFTQRQVALKVMHHRLADRRDLVERFRHEAMALSSIRHENVVNVENAGLTDDGHVFIAMDLLNGRNLRDVLKLGKPMGLLESLQLVGEVAAGVAAAHDIQVIHRDLKPENIFCAKDGPAKVLDLGTAKFAGNNAPTTQTALGKVIGTAAYIAPERLAGDPGDERCDIYALGLVLYECIAGFHPMVPTGKWPGAAEIAARQVTYNPRPIPGLSDHVWNLIAKAIHKKPERRFQSMREFRSALCAAVPGFMGSGSLSSPGPTKFSWAGLGLPVIAGIIVGSSLAGLTYRWRHSPASEAKALPPTVVSVPPIQNGRATFQDDLVQPRILDTPVVPVMPLTTAIAANAPSTDAAPAAANLLSTKSGAVAPLAKAQAKSAADPPVKPTEVNGVESKPGKLSSGASKAGVGSANNLNTVTTQSAKEDLPASGL